MCFRPNQLNIFSSELQMNTITQRKYWLMQPPQHCICVCDGQESFTEINFSVWAKFKFLWTRIHIYQVIRCILANLIISLVWGLCSPTVLRVWFMSFWETHLTINQSFVPVSAKSVLCLSLKSHSPGITIPHLPSFESDKKKPSIPSRGKSKKP